MSLSIPVLSIKMKTKSNLLNNGVLKEVFSDKSYLKSYFYPGVTGLQAARIVALVFSFESTPALLLEIVCYSIASKIEA